MNDVEKRQLGENLFKYLNNNFPAFAQTKNQNETFHFDWADATAFISFLYRVLVYDNERLEEAKNNNINPETVMDLYGLFIVLRSVGIGLFDDPVHGFVIKPFIGQNPSGEQGFQSEQEYASFRSYLLPHSEWIATTLKDVAKSFS